MISPLGQEKIIQSIGDPVPDPGMHKFSEFQAWFKPRLLRAGPFAVDCGKVSLCPFGLSEGNLLVGSFSWVQQQFQI